MLPSPNPSQKALLFLSLLFANQSFSYAEIFSVTNVEQFQAALSQAATNGLDDEIILSAGIYDLTNSPVNFISVEPNNLAISGSGINETVLEFTNRNNSVNALNFQSGASSLIKISSLSIDISIDGINVINTYNNIELNFVAIKNINPISTYADVNLVNSLNAIVLAIRDRSIKVSNSDIIGVNNVISLGNNVADAEISDSYLKVIDRAVDGQNGNGSQNVLVTNVNIEGYVVTDVNTGTVHTIGEGINISYGSTVVIRGSTFSNLEQVGNLGYNVSLNAVGNRFIDNKQVFIGLLSKSWVLESNLFQDNGIVIEHSRNIGRQIQVVNNTFALNELVLNMISLNSGAAAPAIDFYNNAFYFDRELFRGTSDFNFILTGSKNAFSASDIDDRFSNVTLAFTNSIYDIDLGFLDTATYNFNLSSQSILIDAGFVLDSYQYSAFDVLGQTRKLGGSVDIGAYELASNAATINDFSYVGDNKVNELLTFNFEFTGNGTNVVEINFDDCEVKPACYDSSFVNVTSGLTYQYEKAGNYNVLLRLTNDSGAIAKRELPIYIRGLTLQEQLNVAFDNGLAAGEEAVVASPESYGLFTSTDISTATQNGIATGQQYVQDNLVEFNLVTVADKDASVATATSNGIATGEELVINSPSSYGIDIIIPLNNAYIESLPVGWEMISIPSTIEDMSVFDTAKIVWYFNNESQQWLAYSSSSSVNDELQAQGIEILTSVQAGSGVWLEK